jgi:hypothetical protein
MTNLSKMISRISVRFGLCAAAIMVASGSTASDVTFAPADNYAVGILPSHMTAGDFNADGLIDLACDNVASANFSILLGGPGGTFQSVTNYAFAPFPRGLAAEDFNGDGRSDLAVTSISPGRLWIFLGNADGTLQLAGSVGINSPETVAASDLNGDAAVDLIVTLPVGSLAILVGNGDGTFDAPVYYSAPPTRAVAIGDYNGDAIPDLAVTTYNGTTFLIFIGNGNGTFQPGTSSSAGGPAGSNTIGIATADLDEDGALDLAISNYATSNTVSILMGNGNGTFQAPVAYAIGSLSQPVVIADLDGDGLLDLAVNDHFLNCVAVRLGQPGGGFEAPVTFPVGVNPQWCIARDLDNDGRLDLAVTNGSSHNVSILFNTTIPPVTDTDADGLLDNDEIDIYGTDPNDSDTDDDGLLDGTEVDMAQGSGCPDPLNPDSDGDTLSDGAEVALGTSPCATDTDADGIPDNVDPLPLDPEGTGEYVETALRTLCDFIHARPLSEFDAPNNNAAKGRRNALCNKVMAAANAVADEDFGSAIDGLSSLLDKLDDQPDPPDWMHPGVARDDIRDEISGTIAILLFM